MFTHLLYIYSLNMNGFRFSVLFLFTCNTHVIENQYLSVIYYNMFFTKHSIEPNGRQRPNDPHPADTDRQTRD